MTSDGHGSLGWPKYPLIEEFVTYDPKYVKCSNRMRGDFCLKKLRVIATTDCVACEQFEQGGRKK